MTSPAPRILTILLVASLPRAASAACECRCVDGVVQPVCSYAWEQPPICAPEVCPIVPPSVTPVMPPTVPPVGTGACYPAEVFDQISGRYVWQRVCE